MKESANPHRIDPPNPNVSDPVGRRRRSAGMPVAAAVSSGPSAQEATTDPVEAASISLDRLTEELHQEWLGLHAADLVSRLQAWADALDAREARLNVHASLQDSRERQFRLRQQDAMADLAEQQRAIERLRHQVESQVRRLAFRDS